jgi:uncharacterized protein YcnI
MKKRSAILLAGVGYLGLADGALAHVTFETAEAPVGSTYKALSFAAMRASLGSTFRASKGRSIPRPA